MDKFWCTIMRRLLPPRSEYLLQPQPGMGREGAASPKQDCASGRRRRQRRQWWAIGVSGTDSPSRFLSAPESSNVVAFGVVPMGGRKRKFSCWRCHHWGRGNLASLQILCLRQTPPHATPLGSWQPVPGYSGFSGKSSWEIPLSMIFLQEHFLDQFLLSHELDMRNHAFFI